MSNDDRPGRRYVAFLPGESGEKGRRALSIQEFDTIEAAQDRAVVLFGAFGSGAWGYVEGEVDGELIVAVLGEGALRAGL